MRAIAALAMVLATVPMGGPARAEGGDPAGRTLEVGGARIQVILPAGELDLEDGALLAWIAASARAVEAYQGGFPVPAVTVRVKAHGGRGVGCGTTRLAGSPRIEVSVGRETRAEDLGRDWVMTHEMVHLGFPSLDAQHEWMEEGLAMYVEPVARARAGALSPEEVWGKLAVLLPKGLPRRGDSGLDVWPTRLRTYWGGAIFWLLADVEIRSRTHGRRGLDDVVRAIVGAGGTVGRRWEVERVIATGDRAAGAPVLKGLYRRMAASPYPAGLDDLWRSLGVQCDGGRVTLSDAAPLAAVRRAIAGPEPHAAAPRRAPAP